MSSERQKHTEKYLPQSGQRTASESAQAGSSCLPNQQICLVVNQLTYIYIIQLTLHKQARAQHVQNAQDVCECLVIRSPDKLSVVQVRATLNHRCDGREVTGRGRSERGINE